VFETPSVAMCQHFGDLTADKTGLFEGFSAAGLFRDLTGLSATTGKYPVVQVNTAFVMGHRKSAVPNYNRYGLPPYSTVSYH
jgi:hypothetical protein